MRAFWRFGIAATAVSLSLATAPLAAQESAAPAAPADDAIGPAQLRDFNLDGTVIRRAEPAPQRSEPAQPRRQPSTATARAEPAPQAREPERRAARAEPQPQPQPQREAPARTEAGEVPQAAVPASRRASPADVLFSPAPAVPSTTDSSGSFVPAQSLPDEQGGFSPLPWLLALLLLAGGAAYYFRRQRSGLAFAGGPQDADVPAPQPAPHPRRPGPAPEAPSPRPPAPAPAGIVSTRLRPTLEIRFNPQRLALEADRLTIEFEALVVNSGSGPARDLLLEAAMFTAGPAQEREILSFFERPAGQGERVAMVGPLQSLGFRSAVSLPREHVRQFQAGDRTVFVPLVGFNLLYRWSGGDAQTSTSYLVGIDRKGEKLAPFRLDPGPRLFTLLGARELEIAVRK